MVKQNDKQYDVIVIGGGITGAGTARDCAMRGLKVLLVERQDFTVGATGRNHGLLHSGARYAVTDGESAAECIKENMILESGKNADFLLQGLEQALDIMKSMISVVAKRALKNKKEQGYKLGRKTGYRNQKYIWSGKEEEIKQKLLAGMTRRQVAQDTGMSIFSLYNYINQTPELKQALWGKNDA